MGINLSLSETCWLLNFGVNLIPGVFWFAYCNDSLFKAAFQMLI